MKLAPFQYLSTLHIFNTDPVGLLGPCKLQVVYPIVKLIWLVLQTRILFLFTLRIYIANRH